MGRNDMAGMADKSAGMIIVQDGDSVVSRLSLPGTNGNGAGTTRNGAGTRQLPAVIGEPTAHDDHEDGALDVKDTSTLPTPALPGAARSKRHSLFVVVGIVLLLGAVVG